MNLSQALASGEAPNLKKLGDGGGLKVIWLPDAVKNRFYRFFVYVAEQLS